MCLGIFFLQTRSTSRSKTELKHSKGTELLAAKKTVIEALLLRVCFDFILGVESSIQHLRLTESVVCIVDRPAMANSNHATTTTYLTTANNNDEQQQQDRRRPTITTNISGDDQQPPTTPTVTTNNDDRQPATAAANIDDNQQRPTTANDNNVRPRQTETMTKTTTNKTTTNKTTTNKTTTKETTNKTTANTTTATDSDDQYPQTPTIILIYFSFRYSAYSIRTLRIQIQRNDRPSQSRSRYYRIISSLEDCFVR